MGEKFKCQDLSVKTANLFSSQTCGVAGRSRKRRDDRNLEGGEWALAKGGAVILVFQKRGGVQGGGRGGLQRDISR